MTVTAVVGLVSLLALSPDPRPVGERSSFQACDARIDGATYPFLVPAHLVWDELWQRAGEADGTFTQRHKLASELGISTASVEQIALTSVGRGAFAAAQRAQAGADAKMADIDASLDARDRLLKRVDAGSADRIQKWVVARAAKPHRLGIAGRLVRSQDGRLECTVSVNGKSDPHLIPEWEPWNSYFRFMTMGSAEFRGGDGRYASHYIQGLISRGLGNSEVQAKRLLTLLVEAGTEIASIEDFTSSLTHTQRMVRVIEKTMEMRSRVRDEFPAATWLAVLTEVRQIRGGTTFDFPSFEEKRGGIR